DIAIHQLTGGDGDIMSGPPRERGGVAQVHARELVEPALQPRDDTRDLRKGPQPRTVSTGDRVFADESLAALDVGQHNSHECLHLAHRRAHEYNEARGAIAIRWRRRAAGGERTERRRARSAADVSGPADHGGCRTARTADAGPRPEMEASLSPRQ